MQEIELEFVSKTYTEVKRASKTIAESIQDDYDSFFFDILQLIGSNNTPAFLMKYLPADGWDDIKASWFKQKVKHGVITNESSDDEGEAMYNAFYRGITKHPASVNRLGRKATDIGAKRTAHKNRKQAGKASVPPFADYINSLTAVGTTERFFGPVSLQYDFQAPQLGHVTTAKMGHKNVKLGTDTSNEITRLFTRSKGGFVSTPDKMQVTAKIEAFGVLQAIQKTEWMIVDYLLKVVDPSHEKQWVKINGRKGWKGKGNRPIRAVILPMVQFYLNQKLPNSIRWSV